MKWVIVLSFFMCLSRHSISTSSKYSKPINFAGWKNNYATYNYTIDCIFKKVLMKSISFFSFSSSVLMPSKNLFQLESWKIKVRLKKGFLRLHCSDNQLTFKAHDNINITFDVVFWILNHGLFRIMLEKLYNVYHIVIILM